MVRADAAHDGSLPRPEPPTLHERGLVDDDDHLAALGRYVLEEQ